MKEKVAVFKAYPFAKGQKIRIEGGRRAGDWLVVESEENTVTLRCPISQKEFSWTRFCYFVEEQDEQQWPQKD